MKILESTLVPLCEKHKTFEGLVVSDRTNFREHIPDENIHTALVKFIKYKGTLKINHRKSIVGFINEHCFGLAWSKQPFHLHKGYLVRGKIVGPTWIWRNLKSGYYRGLSISGYREGSDLTVNEISLTDRPQYLVEEVN